MMMTIMMMMMMMMIHLIKRRGVGNGALAAAWRDRGVVGGDRTVVAVGGIIV